MKSAKSLLLLLLFVLVKDLLWMVAVPVFEAPDEQAHFAQLQWYAEKKSLAIKQGENLSVEVASVEELLGTKRDNFGNNKFTYHPEYKTPATVIIPDFSKDSRMQYVGGEAAGYPPLYYLTAMPFYQAFYDHNLVDRLFAARLVSLVYSLGLAVVAYQLGGAALAILVSFQPMISFIAAGFHPDNLLNFIYSLASLCCYLILKNGLKKKYLFALAALIFLGLKTKVLMVFILPVAVSVIVFSFVRQSKLTLPLSVIILVSPIVAILLLLPLPYMPVINSASPLASMTFLDYLRFRGPKLVFEMWPWYWGVFKWLGVTLPPAAMKIVTRISALVGVGLAVYFVRCLQKKRFDFELKAAIFFLISTLSYLLYLVFWDFRLMQSMGYSQGLQGRYLLANIIPQMALFYLGTKTLLKRFVFLLPLLMIVLNIVALHTVARSYYDLTSPQVFLFEFVRNKPGIIKLLE